MEKNELVAYLDIQYKALKELLPEVENFPTKEEVEREMLSIVDKILHATKH